jgi:hypothetical protein
MNALYTITTADRDCIFADWGIPAVLEEVSRYFDPETGQLEESETATDVTVIAGPDESQPQDQTRALLPGHQRTFLVREQELPSGISLPSARIRFDGQVYSVNSTSESSLNGVLALECVSDRVPSSP